MDGDGRALLVLYGSETGNAQVRFALARPRPSPRARRFARRVPRSPIRPTDAALARTRPPPLAGRCRAHRSRGDATTIRRERARDGRLRGDRAAQREAGGVRDEHHGPGRPPRERPALLAIPPPQEPPRGLPLPPRLRVFRPRRLALPEVQRRRQEARQAPAQPRRATHPRPRPRRRSAPVRTRSRARPLARRAVDQTRPRVSPTSRERTPPRPRPRTEPPTIRERRRRHPRSVPIRGGDVRAYRVRVRVRVRIRRRPVFARVPVRRRRRTGSRRARG